MCMQHTVILSLCKWKRQKMVVFVVKRYAVREAEKWRYAVRKAKIGRYAVRKGGGGCHPHLNNIIVLIASVASEKPLAVYYYYTVLKIVLKNK